LNNPQARGWTRICVPQQHESFLLLLVILFFRRGSALMRRRHRPRDAQKFFVPHRRGRRRHRDGNPELLWLWTRYQPDAVQVCWFRERVGTTGRRVRKIMVVALARKLLIALWRFVTDGTVPEGAVLKPAA